MADTFVRQTPQSQYNSKLGSRPIILYISPTVDEEGIASDFEQNVIVTKLPFDDSISSLDATVDVLQDSIQNTFVGYEKITLRTWDVPCNENSLAGYIHSYRLAKEQFTAEEDFYMSQFYFADAQWLYIISMIGNSDTLRSTYESYFKTLTCKLQDVSET